jgi:glycosyltransferase involved in cell wall biosynthesis
MSGAAAGPRVGQPLVSIGIPTYNRVTTLGRALDSAVGQTYEQLEIVISDNASDDETESLCAALASRDRRVRYVRQERNVGPTANFNFLASECRGDYVLMLADDDWLDPDYVAVCLAALGADPRAAMVAGHARYLREGAFVRDGVLHEHEQPDGPARVRDYLARVDDNGVFYGLVPRAVLRSAQPLPNVLGNDWLRVARIAFQGPIRTLPASRINRQLDGTSVDVTSILSTFGIGRWQSRVPQLVIAWHVLCDIGWEHPVYEQLGRRRRLVLAISASLASIRWADLAWHVVTPTVARIGQRPRGRRLMALYLRGTRALGAGRRR